MRILPAALVSCILGVSIWAQGPEPVIPVIPTDSMEQTASPLAAPQDTHLRARDAVILGLVEGMTEFLPISSTGHLIIANHYLGLEGQEPLKDASGRIRWYKRPSAKNPSGEPLTRKLAADTFIVVIQVGAIAAVVLLYWEKILGMLFGMLGRNGPGIRLLRNVILAFAPVAAAGFYLGSWIDRHLFSIGAVVAALISGAVLMFFAERWRHSSARATDSRKEPHDLTSLQALSIGLMQCLALWPGTSRSMVTMVGGYFCGLTPARAAEFSFLVGLPTLAGAAVYKGFQAGPAMVEVFGWPPLILGTAVATASAALAVRFLVRYLARHGLALFAVYRLILAAVLAGWFLT